MICSIPINEMIEFHILNANSITLALHMNNESKQVFLTEKGNWNILSIYS